MTEYKTKLKGWQIIAALVVMAGVFGVRLMTFNDKKDDKALMRQLEIQLKCDYLPGEVDRTKAATKSGNKDKMRKTAESIASTKLNIESVQASYPLLKFSTKKDVVIKVVYSLKDSEGARGKKTKYYLFNHGAIGNNWQYKHESSVVAYYLNFQ